MSSIANLINLSMGFESEEVDTLETPVDELEVMEDTAEQVEEEAELQEAEQGVENVEEATAQLEEAEEALESLYQQLQYDIEHNGGVSQEAYPYVQIACASALRKIGAESLVTLPSTESFGGASTRLQSTQIAMESVGESLKKIWDAIVSMIARARDAIVNFFKSVFTKIGRVKSAAEKLKKKAAEAKGAGLVDVKVSAKVANLMGAAGSKGKVDIVNVLKESVNVLPRLRLAEEKFDKLAEKAGALVARVGNENNAPTEAEVTSLAQELDNYFKSDAKFANGARIGGVYFALIIKEVTLFGKTFNIAYPRSDVQETVKEEFIVEGVSVAEVAKIADSALEFVKEVESTRKFVDKLAADAKRLKNIKVDGKKADSSAREVFKLYQNCEKNRGAMFGHFSNKALSVVSAYLSVGYKALKLKPEGASEGAQKNEPKLLPAS